VRTRRFPTFNPRPETHSSGAEVAVRSCVTDIPRVEFIASLEWLLRIYRTVYYLRTSVWLVTFNSRIILVLIELSMIEGCGKTASLHPLSSYLSLCSLPPSLHAPHRHRRARVKS